MKDHTQRGGGGALGASAPALFVPGGKSALFQE